MGRSSFEKIRGGRDLSSLLKKGEELPELFDLNLLFGRSAPCEFEIGSGKGLFLRQAALAHPERLYLGVEIAYRYALISASGLAKNSVTNALMICADAAKLLAQWVPPLSLDAVHVYFPDPWWKKAHRKRRILRADVLRLIEERLKPGGILYFRTDVQEYYLSTLDLVRQETALAGPHDIEDGVILPLPEEDPSDEDSFEDSSLRLVQRGADNPPAPGDGGRNTSSESMTQFATHFERRTRLHHLPVYGCRWTKPR